MAMKAVLLMVVLAALAGGQSQKSYARYVPTKVLAEFFRSEGLDGIRYKSSVGDGGNIVFFDLNVAEVVTCGLFQVNWMKLTSIEASNPYVIQKPSS